MLGAIESPHGRRSAGGIEGRGTSGKNEEGVGGNDLC